MNDQIDVILIGSGLCAEYAARFLFSSNDVVYSPRSPDSFHFLSVVPNRTSNRSYYISTPKRPFSGACSEKQISDQSM